MKPESTAFWSTQRAERLYAIKNWGEGYFAINPAGHVTVKPKSDTATELDLYEITQQLLKQGVSLPVLIRFPDILRDRVYALQQAFTDTCGEMGYQGTYTPVYPIKVNQQDTVVENTLKAENIGLEAGSKPELLAILGLAKSGMVICNGYKDRAYIRLALMGLKLGLDIFIVLEKPSELEIIFEESTKLNITPQLGVRVRLSSINAGKWQNSGGEKSKFGFHATELLKLIERLKQTKLLDNLTLMHFHMGSQVANIHDIKTALTEATQFYSELHRLGAPIGIVDAGGGLGIDYEGTRSRHEFSINYSLEEYAHNIIRSFVDICSKKQLPHPDIITESGRGICAHHAVLVTNVIDSETLQEQDNTIKQSIKTPITEAWHDSQFSVQESRIRFARGELNLEQLAELEQQHLEQCLAIVNNLDLDIHSHQEIQRELDIKLADKIFCNLSIFQSMPDIWGINQIFPIMPIHRLNEKPTRRAIIQDLSCDSDGRIDYYIDGQNIKDTLPLHKTQASQPYLIGFFLLGAYQEILGDMHNLFGDTHSVNVEITKQGYQFSDYLEGEQVADVLNYVHIDTEKLKSAYQQKLAESGLSETEKNLYLQELFAGLTAYTYLEK